MNLRPHIYQIMKPDTPARTGHTQEEARLLAYQYCSDVFAERDALAARVTALEAALREVVDDVTHHEHEPHDWSEQVVIKDARALLAQPEGEVRK